MTTPPLHNTDDQRVVHILGNCFCRYDSTDCWYMQHYQRRGIDKLQVNAILSLLAEAEKRTFDFIDSELKAAPKDSWYGTLNECKEKLFSQKESE